VENQNTQETLIKIVEPLVAQSGKEYILGDDIAQKDSPSSLKLAKYQE
jgi:hypothetical protein